MTKRTKIYMAVGLLLIAILIITISVIALTKGANEVKEKVEPFLPTTIEEEFGDVWEEIPVATDKPMEEVVNDTSDSVQSVGNIIKDIFLEKETKESMAQITIETNRKTKTFDVKEGVDEKTLKKNIGWMTSSARPDEDGLCVLMGHRDTDFKILKYTEVGDSISVLYNGSTYNYSVSEIEIIDSDETISFKTSINSGLVLVTCYPFYYTGSAPKKYKIYARLIM